MTTQTEIDGFQSDWETVRLSDIITINDYPNLKKGELQTYVAMGSLNEYERKIQLTEKKNYKYSAPRFINGDTLFPKMSRCLENGKTAFVDILDDHEVSFGSTEFVVLRATDKILPKFIYYTVRRPDIRRKAYKWRNGTTARRQRISTDVFDNIEIKLPPKREQQQIVNLFDQLDSKIESSQKADRIIEQITQSIFTSKFLEFNEEIEFKETEEFGDIPKSFRVSTLSGLADINMGSSPKSEYYNTEGDGLPFFQGSKNFGLKYPEVEKYCSEPVKIAEEDQVLLSVRAPVGDINCSETKCCIGRGVAALTMKDHQNYFLYHLLKLNKRRWDIYKTGTTFNSINSSDIAEFPIIVPPSKLIKQFNDIVSPLEKLMKNHFNQRQIISETRDLLLPKLMTGELRVSDINIGEKPSIEEV
ncbi:restriction endonuclease subunit S [Halostagnicola bangensis]